MMFRANKYLYLQRCLSVKAQNYLKWLSLCVCVYVCVRVRTRYKGDAETAAGI